jgi:hypothetical protein
MDRTAGDGPSRTPEEIREEEVMMKQLSWRLSILAGVLAGGGLLWPLPGWADPIEPVITSIGASIALTNVEFQYYPVLSNLSAEAATIGGLPALPLLNNGHYKETAAGDFAVTVNLPPLDQQYLWLISGDFGFDGNDFLHVLDIEGPVSVTGAIDEALGLLSPVVQRIIETIGNDLLTQPQHNGLGLLDWSYNRDPADDMTGTFALGSTLDLPQVLGIPFSLPQGDFTFDLSLSALVIDVPEPDPVLIFAPALLGLVAFRLRTARRVGNVAGIEHGGQ